MSKFIVKKACENDIDEIEALYNAAIDWLNNQGIFQWKKGIYPTRESALAAVNENSLFCCLVDGNTHGTFILNDKQAPEYTYLNWRYNREKILVLHTLVVKSNMTGRGYGKAIMEFVLNFAHDNKYDAIRLDVFPDNEAAVRLYLNFGFEYVGRVFFEMKEPGHEWYDCYEKLIL